MATILHSLQQWLPLSEQFVYGLVSRSRHRGVVVSRKKPINRTTYPLRNVYNLGWYPVPPEPTAGERRIVTASLMALALIHRARIVHHHHGYRLPDVAGVVLRLRLPLVVSVHGNDVTAFARENPGLVESVLPSARVVIVPSRFLADIVGTLGVDAARIEVIPSGVDADWFAPTPLPSGPPRVLFVGRFVEKKGLDVLLRAWPDVHERFPDARLTLLGYGPLEHLARAGVPGVEIEPTDPARRADQVRDAIRRAHLVVTPSRTASTGDVESLLLVNLEAQASGRPLVTTRHGGIPEYVDDGRTGLLVPENDADALAGAIVRVLDEGSLAERLAAAGPDWARRFDIRACVERVDRVYDRLLKTS